MLSVEEETAIQLAYLVGGVQAVTDLHRVTQRLLGSDEVHPLLCGGHIEMVTDLLPLAREIAAVVVTHAKAGEEFPGVFEYAVTEPLGAWLANAAAAGTYSQDLFIAELASDASKFFSQ